MRDYMQQISEIPRITVEEEVVLAERIKSGDEGALEELISANLRLVVKIAHDFKNLGMTIQDLVAEGNLGLIRAAEKFDPAKGAKFSSYAAWWIKQAMRRALSEKCKTIRVPVASVGKIIKIRNKRIELEQQLGYEPSDRELSHYINISEKVIRRLKGADMRTLSLQDPILNGEEGEISQLIPDDNSPNPFQELAQFETGKHLTRLLTDLDPREQKILRMRFGLDGKPPMTLEEISHHLGRTRERVRQIQKRALGKLKKKMTMPELSVEPM